MAVGRGTASTALLGDMRSGNALGNAARPLVGDGVLSMRHLVKTNYSLLSLYCGRSALSPNRWYGNESDPLLPCWTDNGPVAQMHPGSLSAMCA